MNEEYKQQAGEALSIADLAGLPEPQRTVIILAKLESLYNKVDALERELWDWKADAWKRQGPMMIGGGE